MLVLHYFLSLSLEKSRKPSVIIRYFCNRRRLVARRVLFWWLGTNRRSLWNVCIAMSRLNKYACVCVCHEMKNSLRTHHRNRSGGVVCGERHARISQGINHRPNAFFDTRDISNELYLIESNYHLFFPTIFIRRIDHSHTRKHRRRPNGRWLYAHTLSSENTDGYANESPSRRHACTRIRGGTRSYARTGKERTPRSRTRRASRTRVSVSRRARRSSRPVALSDARSASSNRPPSAHAGTSAATDALVNKPSICCPHYRFYTWTRRTQSERRDRHEKRRRHTFWRRRLAYDVYVFTRSFCVRDYLTVSQDVRPFRWKQTDRGSYDGSWTNAFRAPVTNLRTFQQHEASVGRS